METSTSGSAGSGLEQGLARSQEFGSNLIRPKKVYIPLYVAKLKTITRGCLNQLSWRSDLPSREIKLIITLISANKVALKLHTTKPSVHHVIKLESRLSRALSCANKSPKVKGTIANKAMVRVRDLLAAGLKVTPPLIEALEKELSDPRDKTDSKPKDSRKERESTTSESKLSKNESNEEHKSEKSKFLMDSSTKPSPAEDSKANDMELLGELLLTRNEVAKEQLSILNDISRGLKRKEPTLKTHVRTNLVNCRKFNSAQMSNMAKSSELVTLAKSSFSPIMSKTPSAQPTSSFTNIPAPIDTAELITTGPSTKLAFDNLLESGLHEFTRKMAEISEQFSRTSLSTNEPAATRPSITIDGDLPHKQLKNSPFKFILSGSQFTHTGQIEAKSLIRESKLTSILLNRDIILSAAKQFAVKMGIALTANAEGTTAKPLYKESTPVCGTTDLLPQQKPSYFE